MAKKNKFVFILLGIIVGITLTLGGAKVAYKIYRESKRLKRYIVLPDPNRQYQLPDGARLYTASSLDRIFKDGNTLLRPRINKSRDLSMARNEYESFQVVVDAGTQPIKSVFLETSDLINKEASAVIDANNITWRVVGYVPTIEPYYPVKYVGEWPDPLLPDQKVDVPAGKTQPFWITIYVPKETPAGLYEGSVKFMAEGMNPLEIPIHVRVYDFSLPAEGSLKTAFDHYGHETFRRYPCGDKETDVAYQARLADINQKFVIAMLKYRMNPILNLDPRDEAELALVDKYRVYGLNNFSIGKKGGTLGNNWPDSDEGIEQLLGEYQTYGELLKLNQLLPYTYIY